MKSTIFVLIIFSIHSTHTFANSCKSILSGTETNKIEISLTEYENFLKSINVTMGAMVPELSSVGTEAYFLSQGDINTIGLSQTALESGVAGDREAHELVHALGHVSFLEGYEGPGSVEHKVYGHFKLSPGLKKSIFEDTGFNIEGTATDEILAYVTGVEFLFRTRPNDWIENAYNSYMTGLHINLPVLVKATGLLQEAMIREDTDFHILDGDRLLIINEEEKIEIEVSLLPAPGHPGSSHIMLNISNNDIQGYLVLKDIVKTPSEFNLEAYGEIMQVVRVGVLNTYKSDLSKAWKYIADAMDGQTELVRLHTLLLNLVSQNYDITSLSMHNLMAGKRVKMFRNLDEPEF